MHPDLVSRVGGNLKGVVRTGDRLVVGLSGGIDSVVLLDILARLAVRRGVKLSAIHINHQVSPNASQWAAFCRNICREEKLPLRVVKVTVRRGNSLEAAAREARYDAFRRLRADYLALAHNQDDQAETLLLQLLRGAGVKGLAAMPLVRIEDRGSRIEGKARFEDGGSRIETKSQAKAKRILNPQILRPLLNVSRSEIETYAKQRGLAWVEDESNADSHFLRNFLRREVLPVIAQRVPAYRATLARSARHFSEAAQLLDDLALADGALHLKNDVLEVAGLRRLSRARAKNLLRWFLASRAVLMPNAERLEEALRQALEAKDDARVCVDLGDCELRRFSGALHVAPKRTAPAADFKRVWRGEHVMALPELGGVLTMAKCRGSGIDLAKLRRMRITVRVRCGGERLQPAADRPRRSLKNLLQETGIPPWRRERLPLLFHGTVLVWVPGIGIDHRYQAQRGVAAVLPQWREG